MAERRILEFLDGSKVRYVMITHSPAYTAQETAESVHIPGRFMAKTVVVRVENGFALAVVPANRDVDLEALRLDHVHTAAAAGVALDHVHLPALPCQVDCGGQSAQTGADNDGAPCSAIRSRAGDRPAIEIGGVRRG